MERLLIEIIDGIAIEGFIPDSGLGVAVSYPLRTLYATAPVAWSITAGALPDGWTLDEDTGEVSGETEETGDYSVTIHAEDWLGYETERTFEFRVQALPLSLTGSLADMTVGTPYSDTLALTGGNKPRNVVLSTVPAGISISIDDDADTATVSGTATGAGLGAGSPKAFALSITVEDDDGTQTMFEQTISITVPAVVWAPTYPAGQVGVAYDHTPSAASGGTGGYDYSYTGTLPPGLTFETVDGQLHGTPTDDSGSPYLFTVFAEDTEGNVSAGSPQSVVVNAGVNPHALSIYNKLVAWWDFEGNIGSSIDPGVVVASYGPDLSTFGINLINGAPEAGVVGDANKYLTGRIILPTPPSSPFNFGDVDFAITGWFRRDASTSGNGLLVGRYFGASSHRSYGLFVGKATGDVLWAVSSTGSSVSASITVGTPMSSVGAWAFVSAQHDSINNLIGVSVNAGALTTAAHSTGIAAAGSTNFSLGASVRGDSLVTDSVQASFDSLCVTSGTLSDDERAYLYNSGAGKSYADLYADAGSP